LPITIFTVFVSHVKKQGRRSGQREKERERERERVYG